MTDVDSSPQQPESLATLQQEQEEETADTAGEPSPADGASGDEPGQTRDAPEGSEADAALPAARPSPEGLREDVPQTKPGDAEPKKGGHSTPPSTEDVPDRGAKEEVPEPGATGPEQQRGEDEARTAGDGEGPTASGRPGKEEEEGDSDRGTAAAGGGGGVGENQPPPTPTFSNDDQDVDDINRLQAEAALEAEAARAAAEADEVADRTPALVTPSVAGGGGQLSNAKRLTNTPLEGAGLPLKPPTAQLPPVARGQVRGQQMTSAITDALKQGAHAPPLSKQLIRARRPPKYIRLATVTVSPARARQLQQGPSLYYEEPRRPRKVITWEEATSARPPLRIDMEGPGPCTYTPRVKPLNETNAPSYSFGSKCQPEKTGGARTAWSKTWFQTPHVWHNKVDFTREPMWPSPSHYPKGSSLGPRQRTMPEAPSFTFGHKMAYSIVKPGAPKEPSPNEYRRQLADKLVLSRGPSFTHQLRREGTVLWGASELTPGPAAYSPQKPGTDRPSFTIQGVRREKSHMLGPYSSL